MAPIIPRATRVGRMSLNHGHISTFANEAFERLARDTTTDYIPTGLDDLDWITRGLPRGSLTVLCGNSASHKDIFASNIVEHLALPNTGDSSKGHAPQHALVCLTGTSSRHHALSLMCRLAGVKICKVKTGFPDETTRTKLEAARNRLATASIHLCELRGGDVTTLRDHASGLHSKLRGEGKSLSLITIDNLQLLHITAPEERPAKDQKTAVLLALKALAEELNTAVLGLCCPTRKGICSGSERMDNFLRKNDLEWNQAIESTADLVMHLQRVPEADVIAPDGGHTRRFELAITNNRNGPIGGVDLRLNHKMHVPQCFISDENALPRPKPV